MAEIISNLAKSLGLYGLLIIAISSPFEALAQASTLGDAIEQAAETQPAIMAAWDAFEASVAGVRAAKGSYFPKVDFLAETGRERTNDPQAVETSYRIESYRLTLTQMLFDGFATRYELAKQNYIMLMRYYEFKFAAEQLGLETGQAYLDVLRYRNLLELAKENYFQHERYHRNIEKRVNAGIDRRVDLSQAEARLALAESNVLTEATNLHDVSVRYHRLVGEFPADVMQAPELPLGVIPAQRKKALDIAFELNPELNAAIENIRSTRSDYRGRSAPMMPRLDLRARKQVDNNTRGALGKYDEQAIEFVLSYNLYRGGSDKARRRQAKYLVREAINRRDRVCREVRQGVSITYNNIDSRARLIDFLTQNLEAISRAREAYRNQFSIGQRTLLDLLDTENEYFQASRTLANANYDYTLAKVRTLAGMGTLLKSMNVNGLAGDVEDRLDLSRDSDLDARCPVKVPDMIHVDFNAPSQIKIIEPLEANIVTPLVETPKSPNPVTEVPKNPSPVTEAEKAPSPVTHVPSFDVKFTSGSAQLTEPSRARLYRAGKIFCRNSKLQGAVEGHTDSIGSDTYNLSLSRARAEAVRDVLIARCADARSRISGVGFGELKPKASNNTSRGRAANRRVELIFDGPSGKSLGDRNLETLNPQTQAVGY